MKPRSRFAKVLLLAKAGRGRGSSFEPANRCEEGGGRSTILRSDSVAFLSVGRNSDWQAQRSQHLP